MKKLLKTSCLKIAVLSLVLTMIFSYIPNALAMQGNDEIEPQDYWTNKGNYDVSWYDPTSKEHIIKNEKQLAGLAVIVNGLDDNIEQCTFEGKTIDLKENLNMGAHYWTPIGYNQESWEYFDDELPLNYFKGNFEGNSHTISKLKTNDKSKNYQGLFGMVSAGSIKNLEIIDSNIVGYKYLGGIAGIVDHNSTIKSCYNEGEVKGYSSIGGIVGYLARGSTIQFCHNSGKVKGVGYIGGVVGGLAYSTIESCCNKGEVNGKNYVGGVVGDLYGKSKIQYCYNNGKIKGISGVGGVIGDLDDLCEMSYCYNSGNVTGEFDTINEINDLRGIGGIAGCIIRDTTIQFYYNTGNITVKFEGIEEDGEYGLIGGVGGIAGSLRDNSKIQYCYSTGSIKVTGINEIGGIVGSIAFQNLCNKCYYCNDQGKIPGNANQVGNERSLAQMKTQEFVNKFDMLAMIDNVKKKVNAFFLFEEVNQSLPVLKCFNGRKMNKIEFDNSNKSINTIAKQHIILAKMRLYAKSINSKIADDIQ